MIAPQPLVLRYDQLALIFSGCEVLGFKGSFEQSQELEVGDATDAHVREPKLGVWTWELHDNAVFQSEALSFVVSGRMRQNERVDPARVFAVDGCLLRNRRETNHPVHVREARLEVTLVHLHVNQGLGRPVFVP